MVASGCFFNTYVEEETIAGRIARRTSVAFPTIKESVIAFDVARIKAGTARCSRQARRAQNGKPAARPDSVDRRYIDKSRDQQDEKQRKTPHEESPSKTRGSRLSTLTYLPLTTCAPSIDPFVLEGEPSNEAAYGLVCGVSSRPIRRSSLLHSLPTVTHGFGLYENATNIDAPETGRIRLLFCHVTPYPGGRTTRASVR